MTDANINRPSCDILRATAKISAAVKEIPIGFCDFGPFQSGHSISLFQCWGKIMIITSAN